MQANGFFFPGVGGGGTEHYIYIYNEINVVKN